MTLSLRAAAIARPALDTIRSRCSSSGLPPHVGHEAELLARMIESLANTAVDEIDNVESQRRALVQSEKDADAEAAKRAAARHLHSLESQKSLMATRIHRELTTTIRHETLGAIAKWFSQAAGADGPLARHVHRQLLDDASAKSSLSAGSASPSGDSASGPCGFGMPPRNGDFDGASKSELSDTAQTLACETMLSLQVRPQKSMQLPIFFIQESV